MAIPFYSVGQATPGDDAGMLACSRVTARSENPDREVKVEKCTKTQRSVCNAGFMGAAKRWSKPHHVRDGLNIRPGPVWVQFG